MSWKRFCDYCDGEMVYNTWIEWKSLAGEVKKDVCPECIQRALDALKARSG